MAGAGAGAILGSFFATLILRWPEGRALDGRSRCDGCGRALVAWELVPLASTLMQGMRCRTCRARIDPLHFRVELACACIGGLALVLSPLPAALGWAVLGWMLLTLAILDARHFWLPDKLTLPLAATGLCVAPWVTGVPWEDAGIGAVAGYGSLMLISLGYRALRGREGLGMGDAKLLGAIGAWMGWQALPVVVTLAACAGLVWAGWFALRRGGVTAHTMVPLGTFLAVAAIPGWLASQWLFAFPSH
nr:A24 family peptidase [Sphingobium subterraneum]